MRYTGHSCLDSRGGKTSFSSLSHPRRERSLTPTIHCKIPSFRPPTQRIESTVLKANKQKYFINTKGAFCSMDPNPGGISSSHMMSRNSASLNRIPTMDNSNEHETEYRSIISKSTISSIAQCRAKFSILKQLYDNMSAAKNSALPTINQKKFKYNSPEKEWTTVKPNKGQEKKRSNLKRTQNDSEISLSQANPEYKNTPQAYSSSDTESYSSNMSEDVTSRIQTMQVDDDDQQDLNHLTNEAVTGSVIGNKIKIFPPSAEAHRAIRREISDERKLKSHTYLLPQEKQLKVVIRGLPNDFPN
ncbi:hypothetical protein CDAR_51561 [Caerostris darwini]|uniref:Uncharacterized protein n=1 Tax=Caerostris darwini TaxID=1538125 RepID=A0AAV4VTJ1_9ARAC|nr:hypothetical protein CDAR_51561 [Caerostris darwini]